MAEKKINVTVRVDRDLREQADKLFTELGMSTTTAVSIFLRQSVREGKIPFEIATTIDKEGDER